MCRNSVEGYRVSTHYTLWYSIVSVDTLSFSYALTKTQSSLHPRSFEPSLCRIHQTITDDDIKSYQELLC
jgi:hypothetical protein